MVPMETWFALLMVLVMLASAMAMLIVQNHIAAVAATSVVSLGLSVIFVMLRAPDVAMDANMPPWNSTAPCPKARHPVRFRRCSHFWPTRRPSTRPS